MDTEKKRWSRTRRSRRRKRNYNKGDGGRQNDKSDERNQNQSGHNHRGRVNRKRRDDYPPLSQDKATYRSKTSRGSHSTTGVAQTWTRNQSGRTTHTPQTHQNQPIVKHQHITIFQKGLEGYNTLQSFPTFVDSPTAPAF